MKEKVKVELDDKIICTKPFELNETLESIREKIKEKIGDAFFLDKEGNIIDKEDEKDMNLEDILLDSKIIKLKSNETSGSNKKELNNNNSNPIINENKESNNSNNTKKIKVQYDLSKYEEIEKKDDFVIYRYSKVERQSDHKLVYQYFFDKFDINDYKVAYIILFVGKTGDGKSTAINAFFNIIKGIQLEDKYRFILIEEIKKEKGQAESQTDGVHLYYLRDYNNEPIIIIDSQGYGDTRGIEKDREINEAFQYIFSSVIDHINTVGFISKSTNNRIDMNTRYIFSCITNLFAGNVSENFMVLATHADRSTMNKGPQFVETIQTDADFLKINEKMNQKWWYAFDSLSIFDNDIDKITQYSFSQLNEFYEEKVKKLSPKDIKQTAEVLNERKELTIQVNQLNKRFQELVVQQDNLFSQDKAIEECTNRIIQLQKNYDNKRAEIDRMDPEERLKALELLNENMEREMNGMKIEKRKRINVLKPCDVKTTHCDSCKRNCHDPCGCWFSGWFDRCTVFGFISGCEVCGCKKDCHRQDNYYYTYEEVIEYEENTILKKQKKEEYDRKKNKAKEEYQREKNKKQDEKRVLGELERKIKSLEEQKEIKKKEKEKINDELKKITNEIKINMVKLQNISQKLELIAMNKHHIKTEDEYIDNLKEQIKETGLNEEEQQKKLDQLKKQNKKINEALKLSKEDISKLDENQLREKLEKISN